MTLNQLRDRVAKKVDEDRTATHRYIIDTLLDRAINRALAVFCFFTLCYEVTETLTFTASDPSLEILGTVPNFIVPLRVSQGGLHLSPKSIHRFGAQNNAWTGDDDIPNSYCFVAANLMAICPPPEAGYEEIDLMYAAFAADLSGGSDVPTIPAEDHEALASGAATWLRQVVIGGQHGEEGTRDMQDYFETIQRRAEQVTFRSKAARFDTIPAGVTKDALLKLLKGMK